jgi:hypothetical protein
MYYDNVFWLELAALAIVAGFGIWRMRLSRRKAAVESVAHGVPRGYDMRRDGQRLSMD